MSSNTSRAQYRRTQSPLNRELHWNNFVRVGKAVSYAWHWLLYNLLLQFEDFQIVSRKGFFARSVLPLIPQLTAAYCLTSPPAVFADVAGDSAVDTAIPVTSVVY